MALVRVLWKWAVRVCFVLWLLFLLLVVLKFYKDNPGNVELVIYKLSLEVPTFILGVMPFLLVALVAVLVSWVMLLRLQLSHFQRKSDRNSKALKAMSSRD